MTFKNIFTITFLMEIYIYIYIYVVHLPYPTENVSIQKLVFISLMASPSVEKMTE